MKVFRIEHSTKNHGPYSGKVAVNVLSTTTRYHLAPWRDGLDDYMRDDWHCGCLSEDTLAGWFIDSLMMLHYSEYICRIFEVDAEFVRISWSMSQCMFARTRAVIFAELSLAEIFEKYKREIYST